MAKSLIHLQHYVDTSHFTNSFNESSVQRMIGLYTLDKVVLCNIHPFNRGDLVDRD